VRLSEDVGNLNGLAQSLDTLGTVHRSQGQHQEGLAHYRRSLSISERLGSRPEQALTLRNIGEALRALGRIDEARTSWRAALDVHERYLLPGADQVRGLLGQS
jgi:tetratricopeptide (TPR) repeat protein